MAQRKPNLIADAMMPRQIVYKLRLLGYDVQTVQQFQGTSRPSQGLPDESIFDIAVVQRRAIVTINEKDYRKLHRSAPWHHGIIICDETKALVKRAKEIDDAIKNNMPLNGKLIFIPPKPYSEES